MKSIIEKLGFTACPWSVEKQGNGEALYSGRTKEYHGFNLIYMTDPDWNWENNKKLIVAAPEMLEALVYFCKRVEEGTIRSSKTFSYYINIIEKTTGKTWEEIKKILNE